MCIKMFMHHHSSYDQVQYLLNEDVIKQIHTVTSAAVPRTKKTLLTVVEFFHVNTVVGYFYVYESFPFLSFQFAFKLDPPPWLRHWLSTKIFHVSFALRPSPPFHPYNPTIVLA